MKIHGLPVTAHHLRSRMGQVCVAITGATPREMLDRADAVARDSHFLEFRLDYLADPLPAIPLLRNFLYERSEITAVATCRRVAGGGRFAGPAAAELEVLTQAVAAGVHLVDVEIETAEAIVRERFEALRETGAAIILSSHDFDGTRDLDKTFARMQVYGPDFYKVVSTAKHLADNLAMKHLLERVSDRANVVGLCMGEQGLASRVLGIRWGSVFTFASAGEGEETGPGQIAARTLVDTYRIGQIETATRIYGVAGNPVRHSLSPVMMNNAFRRETVNGVFLPLETKRLADLLKLVHELPIHGLAVTMPFKQEILPYLEKTDPISAKIGACNTVVRAQDGRLFGFNTDVGGIVRPLERRLPLRGARILVLGAGGAARAAVFGLKEKGADVTILNRTLETAHKLARQAKAHTIKRDLVARTHFDVIVNATPAGMAGQKVQSLLAPEELNARFVFDTVYNPVDTPLLRAARERGIGVIAGVEMFVQQGARQLEIWTGKPAPEDEMLRVVLHALRRRAESGQASGEATPRSHPPADRTSVNVPVERRVEPERLASTKPSGADSAKPLLPLSSRAARGSGAPPANAPIPLPTSSKRNLARATIQDAAQARQDGKNGAVPPAGKRGVPLPQAAARAGAKAKSARKAVVAKPEISGGRRRPAKPAASPPKAAKKVSPKGGKKTMLASAGKTKPSAVKR